MNLNNNAKNQAENRNILVTELRQIVTNIPDFPKPGIVFKDICPLLQKPKLFQSVIASMAADVLESNGDVILGIESRGFLFGLPLAQHLQLPFIPIRKKGKLPGPVLCENYALEYGFDTLEIQSSALKPESKAFIVDDVVATGGTALAAARLVNRSGAAVCAFGFFLELGFLGARTLLNEEFPEANIFALLQD